MIRGRTAFVSGATSGIGEATCRHFVEAGWRVIGSGRRGERLDALADDLGEDFHGARFDIRDRQATATVLSQLPTAFRSIDLLVNNAGLALGTRTAQTADIDDWETMIETNVTGLVTLTRLLLPDLVARRGAIINVSSTAATWPYPGGNVYGGTKAFVRQFSLGLRSDLAGTGVRVTCLEPGMTETEFTLVRTHGDVAASNAVYGGHKPIQPEDMAQTLLWIASLPAHLNVNTLQVMPVSQSFAPLAVARR